MKKLLKKSLLFLFMSGCALAQTNCISGPFATTTNLGLRLPFLNQCSWGIQGYNVNFSTIDAMFPSGVLTKAHGGNGTATPALIAGTNISITGTWPNQTINVTGGVGAVSATTLAGYGITDAVPNTRTVNGHALSANVSVTAGDVGAAATSHTHAESEVTSLVADLAAKQATSAKGVANGYPSLDGTGKIPLAQIPAGITGTLQYQGVWDATANSPTITSGVGTTGFFYKVQTAGSTTIDAHSTWAIGDLIIFNGTTWNFIDNTDTVTSVAGRTGAVTLTEADIASLTTDLGLKANLASPTFTGTVTLPASQTLTTPTIASFTNATHGHSNAAGGGNIAESAVTSLVADLALKSPLASPSFTGTATIPSVILSGITGSTQCLHVNSSGLTTGTGADCGIGGSGTPGMISMSSYGSAQLALNALTVGQTLNVDGTYTLCSGTLAAANVTIRAGNQGGILQCATASVPVLTISTNGVEVSNLNIKHITNSPTAGGDGIVVNSNLTGVRIHDNLLQLNWFGANLGATSQNYFYNNYTQLNNSDGVRLTPSSGVPVNQWFLTGNVSQKNLGWGYRLELPGAFTSVQVTGPYISGWNQSFGNALGGFAFIGSLATTSGIGDIWISGAFSSQDNGPGFYIDSGANGGRNVVIGNVYAEQAGTYTGVAGFASAAQSATNVGAGIQVTSSCDATPGPVISNGTLWANSFSGIRTDCPGTSISNINTFQNGVAGSANSYERAGIAIRASNVSVIGGYFRDSSSKQINGVDISNSADNLMIEANCHSSIGTCIQQTTTPTAMTIILPTGSKLASPTFTGTVTVGSGSGGSVSTGSISAATLQCAYLDYAICTTGVDSNGIPNYIAQGGSGNSLTITGTGLSLYIGGVYQTATGTYTDAITSLGSSTFNYLYVGQDTTNTNLVAGDFHTTVLAPVYNRKAPTACTGASSTAPQYWFDSTSNQWKVSTAAACSFSIANPQVLFLAVVRVTVTPTISGIGYEPMHLGPVERLRQFGDGYDGAGDITKLELTSGTTTVDTCRKVTALEMTGATLNHTALNTAGAASSTVGVCVYSQNPVLIVNTSVVTGNGLGRSGSGSSTGAAGTGSIAGYGGSGAGGGAASATNNGGAGGSRIVWGGVAASFGSGTGGVVGGASPVAGVASTNAPDFRYTMVPGCMGASGGSGGGNGGQSSGGGGAGGGAIYIRAPGIVVDSGSSVVANANAGANPTANSGGGGGGGGGCAILVAMYVSNAGTLTASGGSGGTNGGGTGQAGAAGGAGVAQALNLQ